jgi:MoxR-like ATPase
LQDAQLKSLAGDERHYIQPGPLFWAFAPKKAKALLLDSGRGKQIPSGIKGEASRAVVLLDEIDKADPDVPNDLLVPFGRLAFEVTELGETVACSAEETPLLMLTTNGERDLPPAFLRRCVELRTLAAENSPPGRERLFAIARKHQLDLGDETLNLLADAFFDSPRPERREPNFAEFLDLLRAWRRLQLTTRTEKSALNKVVAAITVGSGVSGP